MNTNTTLITLLLAPNMIETGDDFSFPGSALPFSLYTCSGTPVVSESAFGQTIVTIPVVGSEPITVANAPKSVLVKRRVAR